MQTMGQQFRAARERKRIPLSRAAALTRIKVQHLELMENDDYSKMPAPTYAKGFIRMYAEFLGLDSAPLVQEYIDRHLNPPGEEHPRKRAAARPEPAEDHPTAPPQPRRPGRALPLADIGPVLRKAATALVPHLPKLAAAAVILLLAMGIARCAARLGGGTPDSAPGSRRLDDAALMKQPPVRYLELPETPAEDTP